MRLALDTNAYAAFVVGNASVREYVIRAEKVGGSLPVIAEGHYGLLLGGKTHENFVKLDNFLQGPRIEFAPSNHRNRAGLCRGWIGASKARLRRSPERHLDRRALQTVFLHARDP